MDKLIIEGVVYNSESTRAVIVQDDGRSVLIDDILHRTPFICQRVKLTIELVGTYRRDNAT